MSSPPEPVKKKRALWSEKSLAAAMTAVRTGSLSQRDAAAKYKIPRRTIRNHLTTGKSNKLLGRAPVLSKTQEQDLVERIVKFSKIGMPLTSQIIRTQAYKFCDNQGIKNNFNKKTCRAGRDWFYMFMKRNPSISIRKAQLMNPARAQKLNKSIVQHHFQEVKKLYDELDIPNHPERLYNIDEKGCRLTIHHQQKVLAEKGNRRVHMIANEHAENVTVAVCVSAAGNNIPPMIIFKGKRLKQEFTDNLPPGTLVKMAPKGSMTTSLFIDFMEHLGKYKSPGKCLLVFDGASCHLDYDIVEVAEKYDIVLYCLPSNTTHELQPLDKAVNKSFENYWDQEVVKFMYHNPMKKINKARFNGIFTKVWGKSLTPENIINGFRATGLFPYDPTAIPEDAYLPSMLTENQDPQLANNLAHVSPPNRQIETGTSVQQRTSENSSDMDLTDPEDTITIRDSRHDVTSPSLLDSFQQTDNATEVTPRIICPAPAISDRFLQTQRRLVDYSPSFNSDSTNEEFIERQSNMEPEMHSPVAGPSGLSKTVARVLSSDSESSLDLESFVRTQKESTLNIYDPFSDSSDENEDLFRRGEKTPEIINQNRITEINSVMSSPNDSDDDVPLIQLKSKLTPTETFKELIPTPNFAVVKTRPRRKAINYKGQRIVKDLFENKKEKTNKKKKTNAATKEKGNKTVSNRGHKKATKEVNKKTKQKKGNPNSKNKKTIKDVSDTWYCHGCKLIKEVDMRICNKCAKWYHEECVGLTKDDNEAFDCPDCV